MAKTAIRGMVKNLPTHDEYLRGLAGS
jgi:hypothetical protein